MKIRLGFDLMISKDNTKTKESMKYCISSFSITMPRKAKKNLNC